MIISLPPRESVYSVYIYLLTTSSGTVTGRSHGYPGFCIASMHDSNWVIWWIRKTLQLKQGGGGTELLAEVVTDVVFMASVERERRRDSILSWQWFVWLTNYSIRMLTLSLIAAEFVFFSTSCLLTSRVLLVNLKFEHSRLQSASGWS